MGDPRTYAARFVEDSLGLPGGELDGDDVPSDLVDLLRSSLGGAEDDGSATPLVEKRVLELCRELQAESLERHGYFVRKARWPGGAPFAICITHDVDNVERPLGHVLARRRRFSTGDLLLALLGARSLYDNIEHIAGIEAKSRVRSSFYLLSGNYDLKKLAPTVARLRAQGWEFGLHGDFGTHDSREKMREAVERFAAGLGFKPEGVREHYLRFDPEKTWRVVEDSGFAYDATLGNRKELGFKMGICTPFYPPDGGWEPMRVVELPLVLMDTTLWGYLGKGEEEGLADSKEMATRVSGVGGLFTLLWHQEAARMKGGRQFAPLLAFLAGMGGFSATAVGVARWWGARRVPLVRQGNVSSLAGEPPDGLCLELVMREGLKPEARGGTVEKHGETALVRVSSAGFELRVS